MKNLESINILYDQFPSSINLNDYFPYQKNRLERNLFNNCNFNEINPSFIGKVQSKKYVNTPNYLNSKKTNSAINLNKLNIPSINIPKNNKIPQNYGSFSNLPLDLSNSNFFSPSPSNNREKNLNINRLALSKNNNIKNLSSSQLNDDNEKNLS